MNWSLAATVLGKEIRETLRDRRTLVIMAVVPALLYPGLMIFVQQLALFGQRRIETESYRVAVAEAPPGTLRILSDSTLSATRATEDWRSELRNGNIDAAVVFEGPGSENRTAAVRIYFDATRDRSAMARVSAAGRLAVLRDSIVERRLGERQLPARLARPLVVADSSIASPREMGGYALGRFLPLVLVLMTVLGAFYPAVDLAAGEKERGTLETLLTAPLPADEIVTGKFAAVTLIAMAAALLNLFSMLLTFQSGLFTISQTVNLQFRPPASAIIIIVGVLFLLAVLFASLFLGIAVRSHSFREAQNALTPVYTVSFVPALLAIVPGISFDTTIALVPVAGVTMLFRALLTGGAELVPSVVAILSTIVYAMAALVFAVRAFGREEVLFGASGTSEREMFGERIVSAWNLRPRSLPGSRAALLLLSGVGVLTFYAAAPLQLRYSELGLLATQWLLIGLPAVLFVILGKFAVRDTLNLGPARPGAFAGALLIAFGGLPLGWLIAWLQSFVVRIPTELLGPLQELLLARRGADLPWILFLVAVTPAICEELLFRGVVLTGLKTELSGPRAVLGSAVLFALFHLSLQTAVRFLPSLWIGLLIGFVVWKTRSVLAGMAMHFVTNASAVVLVSVPSLQGIVVSPAGQPRWLSVAGGVVVLCVGFRLLIANAEKESAESLSSPPVGASL